jgi:hypothetical protein
MRTAMPGSDQEWRDRVAGTVKAEMARRRVTYKDLVARLREMGIEDNEKNLSTKISRGNIGAVLFFQCMKAIGCQTIRLEDD